MSRQVRNPGTSVPTPRRNEAERAVPAPAAKLIGPLATVVLGALSIVAASQLPLPVDIEGSDTLLAVGLGLLVVQALSMTNRRALLVTSAVTALAIAGLSLSRVVGAEVQSSDAVALGLVAVGVVIAAVVSALFSEEVSPVLVAFALWMLVGAFGLIPLPLLGLGVGLTAAFAIRETERTIRSNASAASAAGPEVARDPGPEKPPAPSWLNESASDGTASVAPGAIDFGQGVDSQTTAPEVALGHVDDPAFQTDEDDATITLPTPEPQVGAPDSPPSVEVPAPQVGAGAEEFHVVLGEPGRADGVLGEMAPMAPPFSSGSASDEYVAGNWVIQARSSRGASHVHGGEPRQDSYALGRSVDGRYVITAVSDGLGSAKRSNFGSYIATRVAVSLLSKELASETDVASALRALPQRIATEMDELARGLIDAGPSEIAATLVVAVVPAGEPAPIWLARIGDSDALVLTKAKRWASGFGGGEASAVETGTTDVLPHHADRVEVRTIDGAQAQALLLATDGVARIIETSPDLVGTAFADRLAEPVTAVDFQRLVDFRRKGAHDDRTVVAMWHRPGFGNAR